MMLIDQVPLSLRIAFEQGVIRGPNLVETAVLLAVSAGSGIVIKGSSRFVYDAGSIGIVVKNIVCEFFSIAQNQQIALENEANALLDRIKVLNALAERDQETLEHTQEALKRAYDIEVAAQTIILEYEEEQQELLHRLREITPQFNEVNTIMSNLHQMTLNTMSPQEIQTQVLESISRIKQMKEEIAARKALEPSKAAPLVPTKG